MAMRKWHRWVSVPSLIFLTVVAITGLILEVQGFLNDDEAQAETLEESHSSIALNDLLGSVNLEKAQNALASKNADLRLSHIEVELRQNPPVITFYTEEEKPRAIQVNAETSQILSEKESSESTFFRKLHSGELFGDFGRSLGIFNGSALLFLTISGAVVYFQMFTRRPKNNSVRKRFFW